MPRWPSPSPDHLRDLEILVEAHHPLWSLETVDEERAATLLTYLADRVGLPYFSFDSVEGLRRVAPEPGKPPDTGTLEGALAFIEGADLPALFHLPGVVSQLAEPALVDRMKRIHGRYFRHRGAVIVSGPQIELDRALTPLFTEVAMPEATPEDYRRFVAAVVRDVGARRPVAVDLSERDLRRLLGSLAGLSFVEVRKIITRAVVEDGRLGPDDLEGVLAAKQKIVERSGVLEYFPPEWELDSIAGLRRLKEWLRKRGRAFVEPERAASFGLEPPRGLLLLGVQGCGKSLCAKAVAAAWGLPLLRMDPSGLYQKYFGETEKNLARAIRTAEAMAPVVLFIDEMEKAFGRGDSDAGTSQRVFGTFLSWLQDKRAPVFVLATANDVSALPPELLRKGRFDEIFFVDLPSREAREGIFAIHLKKRGRDPRAFDLATLAEATEGFSGSEIEQVVVSGLYTAFGEGGDVDDALFLREVEETVPLSVTMAEKIDELRAWARERAVPAD